MSNSNESYLLDISFLFPNTMSTYGDFGNIKVLEKRCNWRNIDVKIHYIDIEDEFIDSDIYFWGGGQDKAQQIVSKSFNSKKIDFLKNAVEKDKVFLLICGSYQLMGKYYVDANKNKIEGLGILNIYTVSSNTRMIGNTLINLNKKLNLQPKTIIGFENHSGKTFLDEGLEPFGFVKKGFGNNAKDKTEGVLYKNLIGCYQHGPLLPKNPHLADFLIQSALENKYKTKIDLLKLDDSIELRAHNALLKRFL